MGIRTAQALWQDYHFLTKEMMKFLSKQDMDLFYDLLDQRERLQTIIEQAVNDGFIVSPAGQGLLAEIYRDTQAIIHNLQLQRVRSKRQCQVSDVYSGANDVLGSRINWKR